jgi:hypothetical protein
MKKGNHTVIFAKNNDIVEGIDYEVISYIVFLEGGEVTPFYRYMGIKESSVLYRTEETMEKIAETVNKPYEHIVKLQSKKAVVEQLFKHEVSKVDVNTAMDCGFGVIKMLKGEHKGQLFMFDATVEQSTLDYDEYVLSFEMRLNMYLLVTEKTFINNALEEIFFSSDERHWCMSEIYTTDGVFPMLLEQSFDLRLQARNSL